MQVSDHAADIDILYHNFAPRERFRALALGGKIPHGTQHNRLVAIAGALRRQGVCDEAVESVLTKLSTVSNAQSRDVLENHFTHSPEHKPMASVRPAAQSKQDWLPATATEDTKNHIPGPS